MDRLVHCRESDTQFRTGRKWKMWSRTSRNGYGSREGHLTGTLWRSAIGMLDNNGPSAHYTDRGYLSYIILEPGCIFFWKKFTVVDLSKSFSYNKPTEHTLLLHHLMVTFKIGLRDLWTHSFIINLLSLAQKEQLNYWNIIADCFSLTLKLSIKICSCRVYKITEMHCSFCWLFLDLSSSFR